MGLILLQDVIDLKQRKQEELDFYAIELQKLMNKMQSVKREIDLTERIIDMIEREVIIDLKHAVSEKKNVSS
jgi:CII-binding regulator of phage lambda lysogenization HflD